MTKPPHSRWSFLTLHIEHTFAIITLRGDSMNVSKLADINTPKGRGMIKWAPFATMPEQFENVRKLNEINTHVPAPNLTDDLQQELELKLRELVGQNVILRYWQAGHEFIIECTIADVDEWSSIVTAIKDDEIMLIQIYHIYSVDRYDYLSVI